jgi:hypothetical protein
MPWADKRVPLQFGNGGRVGIGDAVGWRPVRSLESPSCRSQVRRDACATCPQRRTALAEGGTGSAALGIRGHSK